MGSDNKKLRTHSVWGKLTLNISINIKAESLADAVEQSKSLTESDFVKVLGEFNDGELHIIGVMED